MSDEKVTLAVIGTKIDHLTEKVCENQKQIDELKEQVNMGRGAIKLVFWLGAIVSAVYTGIRLFK